ncbi:UNKNOWN [Stylonychia lemnae]|uniref:Transmembrane protein n=1 Tax=Stylonychia lemnae TaxID=5949 RepID=A0A078ATM5_STYLE|nr:UNKNOWN [Stylonychia lemnae]|eukprot:CDW85780.1 UNKNOWN [Stylonychia lemnae]
MKKLPFDKIQQNQTLTDFWRDNPNKYYARQGIMIIAELGFLITAGIVLGFEAGDECIDYDGTMVNEHYRNALILLIVGHLYQIIKAAYFAWSLQRKQKESLFKCCLQCWCCYTCAIYLFLQIVYFKYMNVCDQVLKFTSLWLRAEILIFYIYVISECIMIGGICFTMMKQHKKLQKEYIEQQKKIDQNRNNRRMSKQKNSSFKRDHEGSLIEERKIKDNDV